MHVQVISPEGEAKFWLEPKIELAVNKGLSAAELDELKRIVEERQDEIRNSWRLLLPINTSKTEEVLNVSRKGFRLFVAGQEYFLHFYDFPWFRSASVKQLFDIEFSHGNHLYWPELDVDLDLERIEHPEKFPLIASA